LRSFVEGVVRFGVLSTFDGSGETPEPAGGTPALPKTRRPALSPVILNPAMKILTQRRQGAKIRRFTTVLSAVIIHPAGDQYFTGLLFVSPIPLRLCVFAPLRENSYFRF